MTNAQWKYILATLIRLEEAVHGIQDTLDRSDSHRIPADELFLDEETVTAKLYNRRVAE